MCKHQGRSWCHGWQRGQMLAKSLVRLLPLFKGSAAASCALQNRAALHQRQASRKKVGSKGGVGAMAGKGGRLSPSLLSACCLASENQQQLLVACKNSAGLQATSGSIEGGVGAMADQGSGFQVSCPAAASAQLICCSFLCPAEQCGTSSEADIRQ